MKKFSLIFGLMISVMGFSQVNWMTMNQALEAQKQKPKKILVKFYTDWCGMCKRMDKETFNNVELAKYINENYYAVKFNAEGNEMVNFAGKTFDNPYFDPNKKPTYGGGARHQFTQYMNVTAYPTTLFLDADNTLITGLIGYFAPQDLDPYLQLIATDEYKNVKTQEDWEKYKNKLKSKKKK